ncbi:5,10-methenyltetrahydrofolate synthetase [Tulasnella sp. 330]|nr:5,10-methenyltetrahydrofolate synthetase [Tulasnella sp. 330]KAG8882356.1 5,10-methenyltetrahydrofolate synthetase [Tulasnella sp. 331]KAG8886823.1 5,10-methenyltetrahydrofolate synthetase [Tulasnella sp. 332]
MASTTVQAKKALRATLLKLKRALPEAQITIQSQQITSHVIDAPFFKESKAVSCYLSIPGEVDTSSLVLSILRSGKKLFVPKVEAGKLHMVRLYGEEDFRTLRQGVWGIKEPAWDWESQRRESATDESSSGIDLVLMPGVAFDKGFSRIGYGKGYYDSFLTSYVNAAASKQPSKPVLAALALREQILDQGKIPLEAHDWKLDMIVSPDGILTKADATVEPVGVMGDVAGMALN